MSVVRKLCGAVVSVGVVSSTLLATSTPAEAAPTNCQTKRVSERELAAYCHGGTGKFRPVVVCRDEQSQTYRGSWVRPGNASGFRCPALTRAVDIWIETTG